jgi:heme exporter protein B
MKTLEENVNQIQQLRKASASSFMRPALAVLTKDIKCEARGKHAFGSILLFAVTSTIAVSFSLQSFGAKPAVSSSLLWLVVYFSAMSGLSRSFVHEEETFTAGTLKMAACPNAVYLGKLAFNWLTLTAVQIVAVPLFMMLMNCPVAKPWTLISILLLGGLGLSAGATMAAAMVSRAVVKGALFAVICFPLLVPVLAASIRGSSIAMDTHSTAIAASDTKLLICYCGVVIVASLMLFKFVWED